MPILKNNDLKLLLEVELYLWNNNSQLYYDLHKFIENSYKEKEKATKKSNEYNKKNKEYHSLINKISYARKRGNIEKLKEYSKELEVFKKEKEL